MEFTQNIGYLSIILIIVITIIVTVLMLIEKKLVKKVIQNRNQRDLYYQKEIQQINKFKPNKAINQIDKIAKNFFAESFNLNENLEYTELKNFFKKKKNLEAQKFCESIIKPLYSPEKPSQEEIQKLIELLTLITAKEHVMTKEEKEELNKKNSEKNKEIPKAD